MAFFGRGGRGEEFETDPARHFAMLAEVRAYWEGLREGSQLPRRDAIDPRGIAGALENTFLIERVAWGIARFRIAGMQLHDLMGLDVRGMPVSSLIEPQDRTRLSEALEDVFAGPGTLEMSLEAERGIGRPALQARMLVLPLTTARGEVGLALGCLAMHGALGRAPRRFAIAGVTGEAIERRIPKRPQPAYFEPIRHQPEPVAGLAEAFQPFTPRPPRSKPNLRLVYSRD